MKLLKDHYNNKSNENNEKNILKNNKQIFIQQKIKENLKNMRRSNLNLVDLDEKKTFFNQIHNILNNPKILEFNLNGSQINPKLIKNFYEIALHNEIKNNANTLLSKEIIKRDEIELNEKINSLNKKSKRKILNFENNFINSENFKIEKPKLLRRFSTNPIKNNYLNKQFHLFDERKEIIEENENENSILSETIVYNKQIEKIINYIPQTVKKNFSIFKSTKNISYNLMANKIENKKNDKCKCDINFNTKNISLKSPKILERRISQLLPNYIIDSNKQNNKEIGEIQEKKNNYTKGKSHFFDKDTFVDVLLLKDNTKNIEIISPCSSDLGIQDSIIDIQNLHPDLLKQISKTKKCNKCFKEIETTKLNSFNLFNETLNTYNNIEFISSMENSNSLKSRSPSSVNNQMSIVKKKSTLLLDSEEKFESNFVDLKEENIIISRIKEHANKRKAYLEKVDSIIPRNYLSAKKKFNSIVEISKEQKENTENTKFKMLKFFNVNQEKNKYTKLSLLFSKRMTIKVIFFILTMLFVSPFLDYKSYGTIKKHNSYEYLANYLDKQLKDNKSNLVHTFIDSKIKNEKVRNDLIGDLISIGFKNRTDSCKYFQSFCNIYLDKYFYNDETKFKELRTKSKCAYYDTDFIIVIYSIDNYNNLNSIFTITKIIFISFVLWLGALLFLKDSNKYAVLPLEQITTYIDNIQENTEDLLFDIKKDKNILNNVSLEMEQFVKFFMEKIRILIRILGLKTFNYFKNEISIKKKDLSIPNPRETNDSIIMMINLRHLDDLIEEYKEMITEIYSKILDIIHLTIFEHFGEVISFESNKIFCIWEISKYHKGISNSNMNLDEKSLFEEYNINMSYKSEESIKDSYHDYQVGKYQMQHLHNKNVEDSNNQEQVKNEKKYKTVNNLALICGIKLLSRLNYNEFISEKLKSIGKNKLGIDLIFHRGVTHQIITNTDYKIETRYIGRNFTKIRYIYNKSKIFNIPIIITKDFANDLCPSLLNYTREIFTINKHEIFEDVLTILSFETVFVEGNKFAKYYYENIKLSKENSVTMKNELTKYINEDKLKIDEVLNNDSEILFSLSKTTLTFLRFYRYSYKLFKVNQYEKAKKVLDIAKIFRVDDYKSNLLREEIDENIRKDNCSNNSSSDSD